MWGKDCSSDRQALCPKSRQICHLRIAKCFPQQRPSGSMSWEPRGHLAAMRRAQPCLWISLLMAQNLLLVLLLAHMMGSRPNLKVPHFSSGSRVLAWQGRDAGRSDAFQLDQTAQGQDQSVLTQFPPALTACWMLQPTDHPGEPTSVIHQGTKTRHTFQVWSHKWNPTSDTLTQQPQPHFFLPHWWNSLHMRGWFPLCACRCC